MISSLFLCWERWLSVPGLAMVLLAPPGHAEIVPVKVDRWLRINQTKGKVTYTQGSSRRAARLGDRSGEFDLIIPLPLRQGLQSIVVTPLGQQQTYELSVP